ncbi:hypothetical protein F4780DRAFT_423983 [Xylariomycetidae sp. FL0641]|nr:hypothetical protein F4780DRAFT_423983 [Xylariomycetidae sp. FL0641]
MISESLDFRSLRCDYWLFVPTTSLHTQGGGGILRERLRKSIYDGSGERGTGIKKSGWEFSWTAIRLAFGIGNGNGNGNGKFNGSCDFDARYWIICVYYMVDTPFCKGWRPVLLKCWYCIDATGSQRTQSTYLPTYLPPSTHLWQSTNDDLSCFSSLPVHPPIWFTTYLTVTGRGKKGFRVGRHSALVSSGSNASQYRAGSHDSGLGTLAVTRPRWRKLSWSALT